ncbi:MAG: alpha/beta hydrolase [Proteiniphilum sp.]|nr:alpha/beta hydrolase [Proteiniphilum sp.]
MRREKVTFTNSQGLRLSGSIELPEDASPKAFAIFSHCFTCNKNLINVKFISETMSQNRIATLRFDFTGLGDSEGDFSKTDFTSNLDDLIHAARFLEDNYEAPKLLVGHSLGGAASILVADQIESVKAITTIGTPSTLDHIRRVFSSKMSEIMGVGSAMVDVAGRDVEIGRAFVEDLSRYNIKRTLNGLDKPILIMHSPDDDMVGINHATDIFMAARHPKSFISLDNVDHLIKNIKDARYVGGLISAWASRYI